MVSRTLTSPNFNVFRIDWPCLKWQHSPPFTRSVPLLRSLHWLPVRFRIMFKISLLTYKTLSGWKKACLSSLHACHITPIPFTEIEPRMIVCQSRGSRPTQMQELLARVPHLFGASLLLSVRSAFQLLPSRNSSRHISLTWPLPRHDTVTPDGPLMLWNCFIDFAIEHWFGCRATEPGFAGDIGAIEIWLIDWCPIAFLCCPQGMRILSNARLWMIAWSARVTESLGIILGFEAAPMILDSLRLYLASPFLTWEWTTHCTDSGLSALNLVHSSTTSCIRSSMYSEETQSTFLPKHVEYHVNSWK